MTRSQPSRDRSRLRYSPKRMSSAIARPAAGTCWSVPAESRDEVEVRPRWVEAEDWIAIQPISLHVPDPRAD